MSILIRVVNLFKGFLSNFVSDIEKDNPEIAYENSINSMLARYVKLKSATAALVRRREDILNRRQTAQSQLSDTEAKLNAAVALGQDDLALILIEKKNTLTAEVNDMLNEEKAAIQEAEDAKASLLQIQSKINSLKEEKDRMLAKMKSAEARIAIQASLDGFSIDNELQALDKVRENIKNKVAEASLGKELQDNSLEGRMNKLNQRAAPLLAQEELNRLKAARATQASAAKQM